MAGEVMEIGSRSMTRADAFALAGDREMLRLSPAEVLIPSGLEARSPELVDHIVQSMVALGQLVPIIVNADRVVLDGVSRVLAIRELELPVVLAVELTATDDLDDIYVRIFANSVRRDMTVLEAHELHSRAKAILAARGEGNRLAAATRNLGVAELPNLGSSVDATLVGNSAKVAALDLPYGHETLRKIDVMQTAALDERMPEIVRKAAREGLDLIAKTNKVDGAFQRFSSVRSAEPEARRARNEGLGDALYQTEILRAIQRVEVLIDIDPARAASVLKKFGMIDGYTMTVETLGRWAQFFLNEAARP